MIAVRRPLLSLASIAVLLASPAFGQDAKTTFNKGVEQLRMGNKEEALTSFHAVLAMDLSNQAAYELWTGTESEIWLEMLSESGEIGLVAQRFGDLARLGRKEYSNDPEGIRAAFRDALADDVTTRIRGIRKLASDYGEFAVPTMVFALADQANNDGRILTMRALTKMGDDVVLPLVAALDSTDAQMRRNVAYTLGYIGDARASAALARLAAGDAEVAVRKAAGQALTTVGGTNDVAGQYLALADAYNSQDGSVLMPHRYSSVLWSWEGEGLVSTEVPRMLYADELAKAAYLSALDADSSSARALAGYARCVIAERARLAELTAMGEDTGDWEAHLMGDYLAVHLAGADAMGSSLSGALDENDQLAASEISKALGGTASQSTESLQRALTSDSSGAVRGEAAVALAHLALRSASSPSADTIAALTESATRNVQRIAAIIDGNSERSAGMRAALEEDGLYVNAWPTGVAGLVAMRRVPGIDVVIIAAELPDMTLSQVVYELSTDPRTQATPILVLALDDEGDFGGTIKGVIADAGSVGTAVEAAMGEGMNRERELASDLAARSAGALAHLAFAGHDVSSSAGALAGALAGRPAKVLSPLLRALAHVGSDQHAGQIVAVLVNAEHPEGVRVHAARALAGIFGRTGSTDSDTMNRMQSVATSEGSHAVRAATTHALGLLSLSSELRAELIRNVRK